MKKIKKVALYDPYLDTFGGGERHVLSLCQVLDKAGYRIDLLWSDKNIAGQIREKLGLTFHSLHVTDNFLLTGSFLQKLRRTREYDYLIYVTDGSYFFSMAKKNFVFAMVPEKKLYEQSLLNRAKLQNFQWIFNSHYTQKWLKKWGVSGHVLYPYLSKMYLEGPIERKCAQCILSVGRFFPHLHSKGHAASIEAFATLRKKYPQFKDATLTIAGRLKNEDKNYFSTLQSRAKDVGGVELLANIDEKKLLDLYSTSQYYWHFAGYGVDGNTEPEKAEHLGIAPLEAMARGCVVLCHGVGGIREIVKSGKNGFLFTTQAQLHATMDALSKNMDLREEISNNAIAFSRKKFSWKTFKVNVVAYLNP